MTSESVSTVHEFGQCRLDLGRRELHVQGQLADLQPLIFSLLAFFVANVGRVISKDELLTKVWGNSVGSDAMVARAVMKVRRAIGDDGQEPRMLKTVHSVGYRLDIDVRELAGMAEVLPQVQVQVEALQRAPRASVVLPCRNCTGDASFDWVKQGLPGLVQHLAGSNAKLMLPPVDWSAAAQSVGDPLASACEALGALEAVRLELHRDREQLRLDVLRGHDAANVQQFTVKGSSVAELAHAIERAITAGPHVVLDSVGDQAFWEEQLAQALDLERRGAPERALALMDECVQRLPASAQLWLAHAALLRRMGQRDEAGKRARAALDITPDPVSDGLRARALYEMAAQAWHDMKPEEAARLAEDAIAAARKDPAAAGVVPDILSFYASISREREDPVVGIRLAERAIAAAVAIGNRAKESHARVVLGSALLHAGQTHRAGDVLRRAADIARRQGLPMTEAYALRTLALLDEQVGRYALAIDEAQRSAALAASCGNFNLRDSARVQEVVSLVHQGQLEEARLSAERLQGSVANAWENAYSLRYANALRAWRGGDGRAATEQMKNVADEGRKAGLRFANVARLEHCLQLVTLGDLPAAQEALDDLERSQAKVATPQGRAAIRLARGERSACIASLREAASAASLDSADSVQIDVNLAWLLLEDGQWQEVEALVGHVAESLTELLPARILNAAHLIATNPRALADGEWETLVCAPPMLIERCPWLLDAEVQERLRAGTLRRLPELLCRACW